jgi:Zn-dependent protease
MEQRQNFLAWSMPAGQVRGVPIRISWTLLLVMAVPFADCMAHKAFLQLPFAVLVPLAAVAWHTLAHGFAARAVGGRMEATTLWALGDHSQYDLPIMARPQAVVAIAGPVASALVWAVIVLALQLPWTPRMAMPGTDLLAFAAGNLAAYCCALALINLVPSAAFDGGRLWRAVLWPMIGIRRAVRVCVIASFVASGAFIVLGVWQHLVMLVFFGAILLITSFSERQALQMGHDLVLGVDPTYANAYAREARPSLFARWRARRDERHRERTEQEEAREQEVLDRLLAKVSSQGLPSLTAGERAELHRISEKQKKRLERA